jgi:signal transduction histidine kinase
MTPPHLLGPRLAAGLLTPAALAVVLVTSPPAVAVSALPDLTVEGRTARLWTQLAVVAAVLVLSGLAVTGAWWGRRSQDARAAVGSAVLAFSWACLTPAVWAEGPVGRGLSTVSAALLVPALLHLATASDGTVPNGRRTRTRLLAAAYATFGVLAALYVLSRDPFLDPECVAHCSSVDPVVASPGLADLALLLLRGAGLAAGVSVVVLCAAALVAHRGPPLALVLGAAAGVVEMMWAVTPLTAAVLGPLLPVRALVHAALGLVVLSELLAGARRRGVLRRMAEEILDVIPPRRAVDVIAARLRDPEVRLDFFVPGEDGWVDAAGTLVRDRVDAPGAQVVVLRREGRPVARLHTAARDVAARDVEEVLGPAPLLAIESERTAAELRLRLRQLREARRHAVEVSDSARRRAERDLHDGAQHLLLAATFALQEAVQAARAHGEPGRAEALSGAVDEVAEAAAELRRVAHGIYPVLLGDAGLVRALEGLALAAPVPVTVDATAVPRWAAPVELTVYAAALRAVESAGASPVRVRLSHDGATAFLDVRGAGLDETGARGLRDRVLALGGTMDVVDSTLRLELPCA